MIESGCTAATTACTSRATRHGLPHEVAQPGLGLKGESLDHAAPGRVEEAAQGVVLPRRLVLGADCAGVGALAELEVDPLEAERLDDRRSRRSGGYDDPLARVTPCGAEGGERKQVGGVVRADDEERHRLITLRSRWSLSSVLTSS